MELKDYPELVVMAGIAIVGLIFWYVATEVDRRKRNVGSAAVAIFAVLCLLAIFPNAYQGDAKPNLKGGIDLVGGSSFIVEIQETTDENDNPIPVTPEAVQQAISTLSDRLSGSGLTDNLMQPMGNNRIIIEMPGVGKERRDEIRDIIQRTARLELKRVHPQSSQLVPQIESGAEFAPPRYKLYEFPILNEESKEVGREKLLLSKINIAGGEMVKMARETQQFGTIAVLLTDEGGNRVLNATKEMNIGRDRMAVVLDGMGLIAPVVQAKLSREFVINGLDGKEEVKRVTFALNNPMKNPLVILSENNVTPRYGQAVVSQGIYAAIVGLALTFLFVLIYYRFAGIIALLGLTVNMLILFGAMAMFGATFTLPGIAGIVLTIGVAVDANVLIYERLREEMAGGKTLASALRSAYEKAFSAIFDANITSLMTALILLWRASDQMKGFAITLTIGILASMFAALLATRVFFFWGQDTGVIKKLSFLDLVPKKTFGFLDLRKPAFLLSGLLFVGSLVFVGSKGNSALGIDFLGGSRFNIELDESVSLNAEEAVNAMSGLSLSKTPTAQIETAPGEDKKFLTIKCAEADAPIIKEALRSNVEALSQKDSSGAYKVEISDPSSIQASLGGEFFKNSLWALGIGLFAVLAYISLRFEFSFAIGAFAALFHDIVITIGIIVLLGTEISLIHVGAVLTIAGYSINDTIIIFDRIRESLRTKRGDIKDIMNAAINATLSRTILTSGTTFLTVLVLFFFGGGAMKDFSLAIMIGVLVGTYSSIFIASALVYKWSQSRGTNLREELLDHNLETDLT